MYTNLFSIISFSAFAGRLIISPAAIRFTTTGSSRFITAGSKSLDSFIFVPYFVLIFNKTITGFAPTFTLASSINSYWTRQIVFVWHKCVIAIHVGVAVVHAKYFICQNHMWIKTFVFALITWELIHFHQCFDRPGFIFAHTHTHTNKTKWSKTKMHEKHEFIH